MCGARRCNVGAKCVGCEEIAVHKGDGIWRGQGASIACGDTQCGARDVCGVQRSVMRGKHVGEGDGDDAATRADIHNDTARIVWQCIDGGDGVINEGFRFGSRDQCVRCDDEIASVKFFVSDDVGEGIACCAHATPPGDPTTVGECERCVRVREDKDAINTQGVSDEKRTIQITDLRTVNGAECGDGGRCHKTCVFMHLIDNNT